MDRYIPIGNKILIRPEKTKETESGLVMPEIMSGRAMVAEILSLGSGEGDKNKNFFEAVKDVGMVPGAKVLYRPHMSDKIKVGDEELLIVPLDGILAIIL